MCQGLPENRYISYSQFSDVEERSDSLVPIIYLVGVRT
jgi:hypothetical protein